MNDRVVVLDRDGVINFDSDAYIKGPAEWVPIPGSIEAITRLCQHGFRVAVATNQSGLGRGLYDLAQLNRIHEKFRGLLAAIGGQVEMIAFCPHRPDEGCHCRKPETGLLLGISARLGVSLQGVPLIGDSLSDLEAARRCGMAPWLVRTGKTTGMALGAAMGIPDVVICENLNDAATRLIQGRGLE